MTKQLHHFHILSSTLTKKVLTLLLTVSGCIEENPGPSSPESSIQLRRSPIQDYMELIFGLQQNQGALRFNAQLLISLQ